MCRSQDLKVHSLVPMGIEEKLPLFISTFTYLSLKIGLSKRLYTSNALHVWYDNDDYYYLPLYVCTL